MYFDRNISEKGSYLSCVTNTEREYVKLYFKNLGFDTCDSPGSTQHLLSVPCRRKKGHTNKVERRSAGATNP